jgi:hypothetical protein
VGHQSGSSVARRRASRDWCSLVLALSSQIQWILHTTQQRYVHTTTPTSIENFVIENWLPQFARRTTGISV